MRRNVLRNGRSANPLIKAIGFGAAASLPVAALGQTLSQQGDGSAVYQWSPDTIITGQDFLITSLPTTFTGADVSSIIGATTFYSHGFTGSGTITYNVEAGHIWQGHETLGQVTVRTNDASAPGSPFGTPAFDRHATWVGMMIGGRSNGGGTYQTGIAPQTDLRSGAIATSWGGSAYALGFNASLTSLAAPYVAAFGTADVINSSWGATGGSGTPEATGTDARSMIIDGLAAQNRFTTFVASAGNSGSGSNTVGAPGSGYNGITVAALQNNGSNVYSSVASFSSRGPQDFSSSVLLARAPVDIAAPGTNLTSAFYGGQTGGNDASLSGSSNTAGNNLYSGGLAGTSFSAPITSGAVALMHQAAAAQITSVNAEDTRVVKAVLLNAAAKITGWNNGEVAHPNGNGGVRTTQALDYASGAGALDMNRTYTQLLGGQEDITGMSGGSTPLTIGWDYASVNLGSNTDVVITTPMSGEFRVTLDWFRDRTYTSPSVQSDIAFAKLDLQVWNSTFTTLYSDSLSLYNEVEHLTFNLPVAGALYGIRVAYGSNVFGSVTSENFGLAWFGTAVPEPTIGLAMLPLGILVMRRRRR